MLSRAWILILCLTIGCINPVAFDTSDNPQRVVVFGSVSQIPGRYELTIASSAVLQEVDRPVSKAEVRLEDNLGNILEYSEEEDGLYVLETSEGDVRPGRSYAITIVLQNGKQITSFPEVLSEEVVIEKLNLDVTFNEIVSEASVITRVPTINLTVDTDLSGASQPYLRWEVNEAWNFVDWKCHPLFDEADECFFFKENSFTNNTKLFHSEDPNQSTLSNYNILARTPYPTIEFDFRHYFNVSQYSISKAAYEYWETVNKVANPSGDIFDVVPAAIRGNLYNPDDPDELILGYFEVAGKSIDRIYSLPENLAPFQFDKECIQWLNRYENIRTCCYCYTIPGATMDRPDYWGKD